MIRQEKRSQWSHKRGRDVTGHRPGTTGQHDRSPERSAAGQRPRAVDSSCGSPPAESQSSWLSSVWSAAGRHCTAEEMSATPPTTTGHRPGTTGHRDRSPERSAAGHCCRVDASPCGSPPAEDHCRYSTPERSAAGHLRLSRERLSRSTEATTVGTQMTPPHHSAKLPEASVIAVREDLDALFLEGLTTCWQRIYTANPSPSGGCRPCLRHVTDGLDREHYPLQRWDGHLRRRSTPSARLMPRCRLRCASSTAAPMLNRCRRTGTRLR